METMSTLEQLLYTTVRVRAIIEEDVENIGTSFIFNYNVEDKNYLFLVTNKHVVSNARVGVLTFIKGEDGKPKLGEAHSVTITNFNEFWIFDREYDVAIAPLAPVINYLQENKTMIFLKAIPRTFVPDKTQLKSLDAIEEVVFVGYPGGFYDERHFLPITRKGITATPPYIDFNGQKAFLIDASVFPGSSGSPVFLYNRGGYFDKTKKSFIIGAERLLFLGILSAVYYIPDTGEIIYAPLLKKPRVQVRQLLDLGIVYKAEIIVRLIEEFLKKRGEI